MSYALSDYLDMSEQLGDVGDVDLYAAWVAQVKGLGATVTSAPETTGSYRIPLGSPMARYPIARAQALGLNEPDAVSHSGQYWYFLPPSDVLDFFFEYDMSLTPSSTAVEKGTEQLEPQWFKDLSKTAQVVTVIAIGGAVLYGLSFLPRPRRE